MKRRILLIALTIALAAALVGGGTMAWFSFKTAGGEAVFAAGTVIVGAELEPAEFDGRFENVNPGDCYCLEVEIENRGTKAVELRVTGEGTWEFNWDYLEENWEGLCFSEDYDSAGAFREAMEGKEPGMGDELNPVFVTNCPGSDWRFYAEVENGAIVAYWWYYEGGPVPGTYAVEEEEVDDEDRFVTLCLCVAFDGPLMGNIFQGATFTLNGTVEAVQASNNAPSELWGDEGWGAGPGYHPYFDDFDFSKCLDADGELAACCQPE